MRDQVSHISQGMLLSSASFAVRCVRRIEYKLYLLVHETLIGHSPPRYVADMLTQIANMPLRKSLRDSTQVDLFLPRTKRRI